MTSGSSSGYVNPAFKAELSRWLDTQLSRLSIQPASSPPELVALGGDAGFRHYFRLQVDGVRLLAVYAPPATENNTAFLNVGRHLERHGVHVPKVLACDLNEGFFLIEDLGETLYLDHLNSDSVTSLYGEALFALLRIQQAPLDNAIFPAYDTQRLHTELALFGDWFVGRLLGYSLDDSEKKILAEAFAVLVDSALSQPSVIVHRDFHSRNIVYGLGGVPGIIDFQDAVSGPITYDLVSLLKDCYIQWPEAQVRDWALAYGNMALDAGLMPPVSEEQFLQWFDLMGMQRHLKVLGIFSRLSLRDGKDAYLGDLPCVVAYIRQLRPSQKMHGPLDAFHRWFDSALMPRIIEQAWWTA